MPLDLAGTLAFIALFGLALVLARVRPAAAIALLVVCVPFSLARDVGPTTITSGKAALLGAIVGLALRRPGLAALRGGTARAILIAGGLVAAATIISIAAATYRGPALRESFKALEYLALFATVVVAARAEIALRGVALVFAVSVALVAALALAQEATGAPSVVLFHDQPIPRIAGPLEGPNQLAGFLGIAVALLLAALLARGGDRVLERVTRLGLGLGVAAEVLTISRAGFIAAAVGLATIAGAARRRPARPDVLAIGGGLFVGLVGVAILGIGAAHLNARGLSLLDYFWSFGESHNPGAVGTRSQLYRAALALWRMHPIFGIGAGNFERELGLVGFPQLHTHANSLYLQALVEGGVPLLLATLTLGVVSIASFVRGPFDDLFVLGALGASVGFALHQIGDLLVFYPKVGELWWILLALGAARRDAAARGAP